MRLLLLCVLYLGALMQTIRGQAPNFSRELSNVDQLTAKYLRLERALWQVIRSGGDQNVALRRIHETHLTFFAEDFSVKNVFFELDADQQVLSNALSYINFTVTGVMKSPLHSNVADYNITEAIAFASNGIYMTQNYDKIYNIIEYNNFYGYVARKAELQSCMFTVSTIQSAHQLIYDYYSDIAGAQLKAYALTQLSYMFYTVYQRRNCVAVSNQLEQQFRERSKTTREKVRELLIEASREVWVCDPDDASKEGYSDEITRLLQGYVDNEVNMNTLNDCKLTCNDYKQATNYQCFNGSYCAENTALAPETDLKCNGVIVDCDFVGNDMTICPTRNIKKKRYESIHYDNGEFYGQSSACPDVSSRAISWTRWFVHCSNCFCYCDEKGPNSDRYFSLKPVVSDISRNMIVTGVALRKHNRAFFWRISERPLAPFAQVNTAAGVSHPDLVPGNFFDPNDSSVFDGIDYHTMSWQNRTLELDVLEAPAGHLVTGVRFEVRPSGNLAMAIRVTRFDFNTGYLIDVHRSIWLTNSNDRKMPIVLDRPDVPTRARSKSVPDLRANRFVEFGPTDRRADVAQSTVPFLDIQKVEPQQLGPLSGLGLYYKGQPLSGGYVAPKVVTYNYVDHVAVD